MVRVLFLQSTLLPHSCTATFTDLPDLLYPSLANENSLWVINPECAKRCNINLPAAVQASG